MRIQGIDCSCSKEEWIKVLKKTFPTPLTHEGHQYIYLDQTGNLSSFDSFTQASTSGYNWQLTVDDVIRLSRDCFDSYKQNSMEELFTLRHVYTIMGHGAQQTWWSRLIHWFRGLGFYTTHELVSQEFEKNQQQLEILTSEKIQSKYQKIEETRQKFVHIMEQLHDENFKSICQKYLETNEDWKRVQNCPSNFGSYADWHKQEEALGNIQLLIKEWDEICENLIPLTKKKLELEDLIHKPQLQDYLDLEDGPEKTCIQKVDEFLRDLIYEMFDPLIPHKAQETLTKMTELKEELEQQLTELLKTYEEDEDNYDPEIVQDVLMPRAPMTPRSLLPQAASLRNAALCPSSPLTKLLSQTHVAKTPHTSSDEVVEDESTTVAGG